MSTILRLTYASGGSSYTINFDDVQTYRIMVRHNQDSTVQRLLNRKPRIVYHGPEWREYLVELNPADQNVAAYVATLKSVTGQIGLVIYYQNGTVAESCAVHLVPEFEIYYAAGHLDATKLLPLHFVETSSGDVAVEVEH